MQKPKFLTTTLLIIMLSFSGISWGQSHQIHFQHLEQITLENDRIEVRLYASANAPDSQTVMTQINEQMRHALEQLKAFSELELATKQYSVSPRHDRNGTTVSWQGRQQLLISAPVSSDLGQWLSIAQNFLNYQSMRFYVSAQTQAEHQPELLRKALHNYQQKAAFVAKQFAQHDYQLVETRIHQGQNHSPYQSVMRAESMESSAPSVSEGQSTLSIRIEGIINLTP